MPSQIKIITSVNRLLKQKGLTLELNKGGVCSGLAIIYLKYFFLGKEKEYFSLCKKLANPPKDYKIGSDENLDIFIQEIEIAFDPTKYLKGSSQSDVENFFLINGKRIKNEFNIGLVDEEVEWSKIIAGIKNNGRGCYVGSHNHAIAVTFQNNQYVIVNSNYDLDNENNNEIQNKKIFSSATDATAELAKQFFYKKGENIGLLIRTFAHPDEQSIPSYPKKSQIWATRLKDTNDFTRTINNKTDNSAMFAIDANDVETMQYLLDKGALTLQNACYAITCRRDTIAYDFFLKSNPNEKAVLMGITALKGNTSLLARMLSNYEKTSLQNMDKSDFKEAISSISPSLLENAALSNTISNVKLVLALYKKYGIKVNDLADFSAAPLLSKITKEGHSEILELLTVDILQVPPARIIENITTAANHNNTSALHFWIKRLPKGQNIAHKTLITAEIINQISPYNLEVLLHSKFTVDSSLLKHALRRQNHTILEYCLASQEPTEWTKFIQSVLADELIPEPIDLFKDNQGVNAFEVLTRFGKNTLIKKYLDKQMQQTDKEKALQFACETGNTEIVEVLSTYGCQTKHNYKMMQLKLAVENDNFEIIDAIIASRIDEKDTFSAANHLLIAKLISLGKHTFLIQFWPQLPEELKRKFLVYALNRDNKELIDYIARTSPELCLTLLQTHIVRAYKNNLPTYLTTATSLFNKIPSDEIHAFWRKLHEKNHSAGEYLLHYAVLSQHFELAKQIFANIPLTHEEQYKLFICAQEAGNNEAIEFLINNDNQLLQSPNTYLDLEKDGKYALLATFLKQNKLHHDSTSLLLLNNAVIRNDINTIEALKLFINRNSVVEESPLYKALQNHNDIGAVSLITHGAKKDESPLPTMIYDLAIETGNTVLLLTAMAEKDFSNNFFTQINDSIEKLLEKSSPDVINLLAGKITLNNHFEPLLKYALKQDDVPLFRMLQETESFAAIEPNNLFKEACTYQSIKIVNALLERPISFSDKNEIHDCLKPLFGIKNAHEIYDLVYKNALNHLYLFIKQHNYPSPLNLLHKSIDEIIFDPGLRAKPNKPHKTGALKNALIRRALDEENDETLNTLLNQLHNKIQLEQGGLELFTNNLDKPILLRVLFEHYPFNEVLSAAYKNKEWLTLITLLKNKTTGEIPQAFISTLLEHTSELMEALASDAKHRLADDPRHALNALLDSSSDNVLNHLFSKHHGPIKLLVMTLETAMIDQKIDLKKHYYRYDLYDSLAKINEALRYIEPFIEKYLQDIAGKTATDAIADDATRLQLIHIKQYCDDHNVSAHYFEEKDRLLDLFDNLGSLHKPENNFKEQPTPSGENPAEEPTTEEPTAEEQKTQPAASENTTPETSPLQLLITEVEHYIEDRKKLAKTKHTLPFFQYTKDDKIIAGTNFINAMRCSDQLIAKKHFGALNNGELCTRINKILRANKNELSFVLQSNKPLNTVDDLIHAISSRDPGNTLIHVLKTYSVARAKRAETYHATIFKQFTKSEKMEAVDKLTLRLQGTHVDLTARNIAALKQGALGNNLKHFINEYGSSLAKSLDAKKGILSIDDLIMATSSPSTPKPTV